MRQHQTSAFRVPTTLFFCWVVGKHFTLRLRNLDCRLQLKERAVECRDVFFWRRAARASKILKVRNGKGEKWD